MEFEWDPDEADRNLAKHGVRFGEAGTVFGDPLAVTYADPDHSGDEDRFLTFGHSAGGDLLIVSHSDRGDRIRITAHAGRLAKRGGSMSEAEKLGEDELRSEYDASALTGGIRGKYLQRYRSGTNLALLTPEVSGRFPDR